MNQGQVINQGKAMSKSLGNGVDLGKQIDEFGVDAIRTTVVFAGPPEDDIDWADVSPGSTLKFLQRAYRLAQDVASPLGTDPAAGDLGLRRATHKAVAEVTEALESKRFNVAVARIMELVNATRKVIDSGAGAADPAVREAVEAVAVILSPIAPYVAEEMWELLGQEPSVARATWPTADPALLVAEQVTCVVQVQGKVRAKLDVSPSISAEDPRGGRAGRPGRAASLGRAGGASGDRPGAQAGQHRPRLSRDEGCGRPSWLSTTSVTAERGAVGAPTVRA